MTPYRLSSVFPVFFVYLFTSSQGSDIPSKIIEWTSVTPSQAMILKPDPVGIERGPSDISDLFLCRSLHTGYYIPGKLRLKDGTISCIFGFSGAEIVKSDFQILSAPAGTTSWYPYLHNEGFTNAVIGARLWATDVAYICRAKYNGNAIPGFMHTDDNGKCNIAVGGKEVQIVNKSDIEILVVNNYGTQLGVTQPMH